MSNKKLSELPDFASKKLLYAAEKRGTTILHGSNIADWPTVTLVGLAEILLEADADIRKYALADEQIKEMIVPRPQPKKKWWRRIFG